MKTYRIALIACMFHGCGAGSEGGTHLAPATEVRRVCPTNRAFSCSENTPWPAATLTAQGEANFPVDEKGCLRRQCKLDADCAEQERCFEPECYPLNVSCADVKNDKGEIQCICTADPACGGAYCVARD